MAATDLSVKDEDLEEGVHEKDPVRLDGGGVEQDGLRGPVEGVRVQNRLDHDEALGQIFAEKTGPEKWQQNVHRWFNRCKELQQQ